MGTMLQKITLMMEPEAGADAVMYSIEVSPSAWCLNSDGTVPFESLYLDFPKVKVYRTTGTVREDVTRETNGADRTLVLKMIADGTEVSSRLVWVNTDADYHYRLRPVNSEGLGYRSVRLELREEETLWASADCSISQAGLQGDTGPFTPPPQQWSDYPVGFEFTDGTGGTPKYVVYHGRAGNDRMMSYVCRKTHKKRLALAGEVNGTEPGIANSQYWEAGQGPFSLVATDVLLAANAFIEFLSSRGLRFYGTDGEVRGEFLGGSNILGWLGGTSANPMWAVTEQGVQTVGGTSGQRIELDPQNKAMYIYNGSGALIATHSGRKLSVADAKPTDAASSKGSKDVTIPVFDGFEATPSYETANVWSFDILEGTAKGFGTLTVTVPAFMLEIGFKTSGASTDKAAASLYLDVTVGNDTKRYGLGGVSNTGGTAGGTTIGETQARSIPVSIPSGSKYAAKLTLEYYVRSTSGATGYFKGSSRRAGYELVTKAYRCEYGANGWVISNDSRNYAYLIVDDSGVLHFTVVSGGETIIES